MANPTAGIARTERYTYQSLHWGLPMAPVIVLLYALMTRTEVRPAGLVVAVVVACAVAAWAGLVVLHTGMRRAGDLEPQRWDRWWHAPARMRLHIAVWAVASLLTCGLASFLIPAVVEPGGCWIRWPSRCSPLCWPTRSSSSPGDGRLST